MQISLKYVFEEMVNEGFYPLNLPVRKSIFMYILKNNKSIFFEFCVSLLWNFKRHVNRDR